MLDADKGRCWESWRLSEVCILLLPGMVFSKQSRMFFFIIARPDVKQFTAKPWISEKGEQLTSVKMNTKRISQKVCEISRASSS